MSSPPVAKTLNYKPFHRETREMLQLWLGQLEPDTRSAMERKIDYIALQHSQANM